MEPRHVAPIQMLAETVPASAFKDAGSIEGKVAIADIVQGEMLLAQRFADQSSGSALAAVVGENMRAVSVRVNDVVGVAGFLLPGNRVDVVAAYREQTKTVSDTIVQNVRVLAIDQTASSDKNEPVVVRAVTLEVTPADAEKLVLAEQRGEIQLALRNPLDAKVTTKAAPAVAAVVNSPSPASAPGRGPRTPRSRRCLRARPSTCRSRCLSRGSWWRTRPRDGWRSAIPTSPTSS
jgi:pilus assembly protein CpaB